MTLCGTAHERRDPRLTQQEVARAFIISLDLSRHSIRAQKVPSTRKRKIHRYHNKLST